ncbi:unnamed protein product (mitochondrion) [Plasmodiophora brassicae]|uniref:DEP domain-containing protein n=1 Tax=Plasmodiophora brassicae TaxID=37360 RepID=A0A3P3YFD5_PLABS|nr:unnamed protein product [Plasmodiophora brassicae]
MSGAHADQRRRVGRWRQHRHRKHVDETRPQANEASGAACYNRVLVVHEERFRNSHDLRVNPESFPGLQVGDLIQIYDSERSGIEHRLQIRVAEMKPVKGSLQISVRKSVADLFELKNRSTVTVRLLSSSSPDVVRLDFVELSFSGQYISRGDMWRYKQHLIDSCVYVGQTKTTMGVHARIEELLVDGKTVKCGLITEHTKFVFRSRAARIMWLIQLSKEMWDYGDDGQLYFEKVVNGLLKVIFKEWQRLNVDHTLTIVLFARTFYLPDDTTHSVWGQDVSRASVKTLLADVSNVFQLDHQQRLYQDFFKLVVESEVRRDWVSLRSLLVRDINRFSQELRWGSLDNVTGLKGVPSRAMDGNILEAINLAINIYDKHYIDRDLTRTGQAVVVITAGTGVWMVDKNLIELTKERMVDNGVGCDLVSMARPPLHAIPLFIYKQPSSNESYSIADDWLDMKFFEAGDWCLRDEQGEVDNFVPIPLCRMFPSGCLPSANCSNDVVVPFVPASSDTSELSGSYCDSFDNNIFVDNSETPSLDIISVEDLRRSVLIRHSGSFPSLDQLRKSLGLSAAQTSVTSTTSIPKIRSMSSLNIKVNANENSGSPNDSIPKRWTLRGPSSCSPPQQPYKIRISSSEEMNENEAWAHGPRRLQTIFRVQGVESRRRAVLIESVSMEPEAMYGTTWARRSESVPAADFDAKAGEQSTPLGAPVSEIPGIPDRVEHALSTQFLNAVHTLSLVPNDSRYHDRAENLLSELIAQRLTSDFQLMVPAGAAPHQALKFQLSLGSDHHQIELDREAENIEVHRYFRKGAVSRDSQWSDIDQPAFPYRYFLWSNECSCLIPQDVTIQAHPNTPYNWNYADQFIAGHVDDLTGLKYRRIRFAILPIGNTEQIMAFLERLLGKPFNQLGIDGSPLATTCVNVDLGFVDYADRHQSFRVQLDRRIEPNACFHVEVQWLMATGASISSWIDDSLKKTAKDHGLSVVRLPACHYHPEVAPSPFHPSTTIPIGPESLTAFVQSFVTNRLGFVVDVVCGVPLQYLHISGLAIIRVLQDGLQWIPHPLARPSDASAVFQKFNEACTMHVECRSIVVSLANEIVESSQGAYDLDPFV